MAMRTHGTLTKWNDDRGFGFIAPASGSAEIFVHISAFPHDGTRPRIGELVSYEVEPGDAGKIRAVRIMRPGGQRTPRSSQRRDTSRPKNSSITTIVSLLAVSVIGVVGYKAYVGQRAESDSTAPVSSTSPTPIASSPSPRFQCDGREYCSQMTSYEEAKFFIQNCPNTKMDGDGDGIPCESQFNK